MLKGIFKRDEEDHPASSRERQIVIERQAEEAEEAMNLLSDKDADDLDETMEEINAAVKKAAKATLQDIRMMEEGRCPACGQKTQQFLFTSVCASCGWFSFISPEEGKSIIHLKTGRNIECGTTFDTQGDYILGITEGVVRAKVTKDNVQHIEYVWSDEEIEKKRAARAREQAGICSWCEKGLTQAEEEVIVVYAAFGSFQDRYIFCSKHCSEAFQHQYPIRVHKNCYNRPCPDCDLCVKKYSGEDETLLVQLESAGA
jgi:hypothetical protein